MTERILFTQDLISFREYLLREEKSGATVEKYCRDVSAFWTYAETQAITKEVTVAFKKHLEEKGYAVCSINSMLASLNSLLEYMGWSDCKVKHLKQQRQIYRSEEKELSKEDYKRLLDAAKEQEQLKYCQALCL